MSKALKKSDGKISKIFYMSGLAVALVLFVVLVVLGNGRLHISAAASEPIPVNLPINPDMSLLGIVQPSVSTGYSLDLSFSSEFVYYLANISRAGNIYSSWMVQTYYNPAGTSGTYSSSYLDILKIRADYDLHYNGTYTYSEWYLPSLVFAGSSGSQIRYFESQYLNFEQLAPSDVDLQNGILHISGSPYLVGDTSAYRSCVAFVYDENYGTHILDYVYQGQTFDFYVPCDKWVGFGVAFVYHGGYSTSSLFNANARINNPHVDYTPSASGGGTDGNGNNYNDGYFDGFNAGEKFGYPQGYDSGYLKGFSEGKSVGRLYYRDFLEFIYLEVERGHTVPGWYGYDDYPQWAAAYVKLFDFGYSKGVDFAQSAASSSYMKGYNDALLFLEEQYSILYRDPASAVAVERGVLGMMGYIVGGGIGTFIDMSSQLQIGTIVLLDILFALAFIAVGFWVWRMIRP